MSEALARAIVGALGVDPAGASREWRGFGGRQWGRTLPWLDLSGLALYFRDRIAAAGALALLPDAVRGRLDLCDADNRARAADAASEIFALSALFRGAGLRHAVLKGLSMVPDYCADAALRTQYDQDLLFDPDSLGAVDALLGSRGYTPKSSAEHPVVYKLPSKPVRFPDSSRGFYSRHLSRPVEVHVRLWDTAHDNIDIPLQTDWLSRSVEQRIGGQPLRVLAGEDALVFQVLHAFHHILGNWCRLSILFEISHFVGRRAADHAFWSAFLERIRPVRGVADMAFVVFSLAEEIFGERIPEHVRTALHTPRSPALRLWIERYGAVSALGNFRGDKFSLFLHEEFVADRASWRQIRMRRLFPAHRPHRPSALVFQRGFSLAGKARMECMHALRRLRFHGVSAARYALEYPRWILLRHARLRSALPL